MYTPDSDDVVEELNLLMLVYDCHLIQDAYVFIYDANLRQKQVTCQLF